MSDSQVFGLVVQANQATVVVEPEPFTGCGKCHQPGGCRSGLLASLFGGRETQKLSLPNSINARVGDWVEIEMAEGLLGRGVLHMYVLPLVLAMVFALMANQLAQNIWASEPAELKVMPDVFAGLGLLLGLVVGYVLGRLRSIRIDAGFTIRHATYRMNQLPTASCRSKA